MSGARTQHTLGRIAAALSVALLATALDGCTFGPRPPDEQETAGQHQGLEAFSRQMLDEGAPAVLIELRHGPDVWTHGAGVRNLETGEPVTAADPFQVGSISKSMVAVSVLKLVEEGLLNLDAPVSAYLQEFGTVLHPPRPVTVHQLLIHESGLPDFIAPLLASAPPPEFLNRPLSLEQQLALAATVPWERKLVQGFEYSSSNYSALGLIAQRIRGQKIADVLKSDIADPLGLRETRLPGAGPPPENMVHAYITVAGKRLDVTHPAWLAELAPGGVVSTVNEVNTFYSALLQGKVLAPATMAGMRGQDGARYGQGLQKWNDLCTNRFYYGHTGDADGYGTVSMTSEDGTRQLTLAVAYPPAPPTLSVNPLISDLEDVAQETLNDLC
ncbi:beta-lactamase family protein [Arthrobacter sp. D1-29]